MSSKLPVTMAILLCVSAGSSQAIDNDTLNGINFNGFLTIGASKSDTSVDSQDGTITENIGFEQDSRVGIQVSADINPRMNITAQLIGQGRKKSYDAKFDWGYVSYAVNDKVTVRAGKLKLPTFLISDYYEVGYAYPWVRPPQEVYTSNPITALSGVDMLYRTTIGKSDLLFQPYFGTSRGEEALIPQEALGMYDVMFDPDVAGTDTAVYTEFSAENFIGFNASLGTEAFSVRAGYLETDVSVSDFNVSDEDVIFASVGLTADWNNYVVYSEYFEREIKGAANSAFPNQKGWYATFGYRMNKFLPHITYARLEDHNNPTNVAECGGAGYMCGTPLKQESVTLGLRYELDTASALKFEIQNIDPGTGTRGLFMNNTVGSNVNVFNIALDVVF